MNCLDLEIIFFLDPTPQHHKPNTPKNLMVGEKNGFEVPHLRPKGKMPLSLASEWILNKILEIMELDEEEDLVETFFH